MVTNSISKALLFVFPLFYAVKVGLITYVLFFFPVA